MNIENIINQIKNALGSETEVTVKEVVKNNGITLTGIEIREAGSNVSPVIYPDITASDEDIVNETLDIYNASKGDRKRFSEVTEDINKWEAVKNKILPVMVNNQRNKIENLVLLPFIGDLSIGFRVLFEATKEGTASARVTTSLFKAWNITEEKLLEQAKENLNNQLYISDMLSVLDTLTSGEQEATTRTVSLNDIMNVASNLNKVNGASALLLIPDLIRNGEIENRDYTILPSSVHEVIILKQAFEQAFVDMVKEVNGTMVSDEDYLSDNVFIYNASKQAFEVAC